LGHGLGSFATDFFRYRAETDMSRLAMVDQPGAFREVHNDYLQVWEELGVIGLLLFVALLIRGFQ
jgi:O-antigen ligase